MIVLDASAIVAILLGEEEKDLFAHLIAGQASVFLGAPTLLEARIVLVSRLQEAGPRLLDGFLAGSCATIVPLDAAMYAAASQAFSRYGRGRHPAKLNFGDCMSYAVASVMRLPLLFKGDDFVHTDIVPAYAPLP